MSTPLSGQYDMMPGMGFLDGLINALTSSNDSDNSGAEKCPECGSPLNSDGTSDRGTERFECTNHCNEPVWFRENGGPLITPTQRNRGSGGSPCISCGQSMAGGELTVPYEDGNNEHAYVKCPHCGTENMMFGFGEDD